MDERTRARLIDPIDISVVWSIPRGLLRWRFGANFVKYSKKCLVSHDDEWLQGHADVLRITRGGS